MTMIVVDAVVKLALFTASIRSVQFTLVPFKSLLTGLITNLDTRGNSSWLETLEKLNDVELTVWDHAWSVSTVEEAYPLEYEYIPPWSSDSNENHRWNLAFVLQISSSSSPSHTTASSEGDNRSPVYMLLLLYYLLILCSIYWHRQAVSVIATNRLLRLTSTLYRTCNSLVW